MGQDKPQTTFAISRHFLFLMIQRDDFPYLQSFVINDAYAVKNMTVPVFAHGEPFKHLILTGRNGSGKTTVLQALNVQVQAEKLKSGESIRLIKKYEDWISSHHTDTRRSEWAAELQRLTAVTIYYRGAVGHIPVDQPYYLVAFFEATRKVQVQEVITVSRDTDLAAQLTQNPTAPATLFKQYLVNKKVFQIFEVMEGNEAAAQQEAQFFTDLEKLLADVFSYPALKLEFVRENFEFYIHLAEGRRVTFNQLSAGFSAFLSILTDLLLRVDLLRKELKDYRYNPCGFVFIDEPETHLHLEMQYQILPWLTHLFPNLQFIVATHSPAVASSIKSATVFDLSTGEVMGDEAAGSSYSELMLTHFGVKDEYSNVADAILADINRIAALPDPTQARQEFLMLLEERGRYMSPGLRLEVEAQLAGLE